MINRKVRTAKEGDRLYYVSHYHRTATGTVFLVEKHRSYRRLTARPIEGAHIQDHFSRRERYEILTDSDGIDHVSGIVCFEPGLIERKFVKLKSILSQVGPLTLGYDVNELLIELEI